MDYPAYYTQPFHAYEDGNLNWLAAAEVESATSAMCLRVREEEGREGGREGGRVGGCIFPWTRRLFLRCEVGRRPFPLHHRPSVLYAFNLHSP